MPKPARIELWTDVECNSGTRESWIVQQAGNQALNLDNSSSLTLTIADDDDWDVIADLEMLKVIRVTTHVGSGSETVYEWRISSIKDGEGPKQNTVQITGEPILYDLRNAIIRRNTTGGRPDYNLGGMRMSAAQYIDTYVLPALTAAGITWVSRGTVDASGGFDIGMSRATALENLQELADKSGCELRLRRDGATDYKIDLLTLTGSGSATPRVQFGRNLLSVIRERNLDGYATRLYPMGKQVDGRSELSCIGYNAWEVASTATGNVIVASDPGGGDGPVGFDDQLNGKYVCSPSAALTEISDSTASSNSLTLATSHNLVAGDHFTVFDDASKTLMTVLTNPAGEASVPIKTVGRLYNQDYREERNWVPNPITSDWATGNLPDNWSSTGALHASHITGKKDRTGEYSTVTGAQADGAHSATGVVNIKNLSTGTVIQPGDRFNYTGGLSNNYIITTTGIASASGRCSVSISRDYIAQDTFTATDGQSIPISRANVSEGAGSDNAIHTTNSPQIITPAITVPYISNDASIWAAVGYTAYSHASGIALTSSTTPKITLQTPTGATLASGIGATGAMAAGANLQAVRVSYTLTEDKRMRLKFWPVRGGAGSSLDRLQRDVTTFVRWAQITIGPDSRVPVVNGSWGNKLWQYANRKLNSAQLPDYITCLIRDLSDVDGYTLNEEDITLGGNIHVISDKLGLDTDIRVVSIVHDLVNPENTKVVLDTQRKRASSRLRGAVKPYETQPEPEPGEGTSKEEKPEAEQPADPTVVRVIEDEPVASGGAATPIPLVPSGRQGVPGIEL